MDFPYGETVTVIRNNATDDLGDKVGSSSTASWGPCAVAPRYATEGVDPHSPAVVVGLTVYGPADVTIKAGDQIRRGSTVYNVDGDPNEWLNPFTGWAPGLEVSLILGKAAL